MFGQHVGRFAPHLSHCNNPFEVKKMLKEEKTLLIFKKWFASMISNRLSINQCNFIII